MRVRLLSSVLAGVVVLCAQVAAQGSPWEKPAAEIARRIADTLGPASAHITWANLSHIPDGALPAIHHAVETDLAADGVSPAGPDSANSVRITISQDSHGDLWVAEIQQGTETRVAMVRVDVEPTAHDMAAQKIRLKRQAVAKSSDLKWKLTVSRESAVPQILAAAEADGKLIVLTSARVGVFNPSPEGWSEIAGAELGSWRAATRDPRGIVVPSAAGFEAWAPGVACSGLAPQLAAPDGQWTIQCHSSDDPWPIAQTAQDTFLKAFYNGARNYFTGVVTPASAPDLPPFYTAAILTGRSTGPALLVAGIDGKVSLAEAGELKPVAGTRDWGSDFAVIPPACGATAEVIVSSSGEALSDSLRAFEIAGQEASPASEPLDLGGTAIALWPASDGKSATVIVRLPLEDGRGFQYEVDRVTTSCD